MKDTKLKRKLVAAYEVLYEARRMAILRTKYRLPIMNSTKTIKHVIKNNCSVARYGDGEFKLMLGIADIGFQQRDVRLADNLCRVLSEKNDNLLICVPSTFNSVYGCNDFAHHFWIDWGRENSNQINVVNLLRSTRGKYYRYGDTEMTRTYIDWKSDARAKKLFPLLKQLWNNQDILFIEGEMTRLGVGNDLFSNARSIQRILAPAKNAFSQYDNILKTAIQYGQGKLVILALGPTATVLANDLHKQGIRAMDLGHIDIEYEWYLRGTKSRIHIPGKYTNEAKGDPAIANCQDKTYLGQIIARVGC